MSVAVTVLGARDRSDAPAIPLADIAVIRYGKPKPEAPGTVPVYGSGGPYAFTDRSLVGPDALIVGRKGNAGSIWWPKVACWPSDTTFYLEPDAARLDVEYLYYWLIAHPLSGEHAKTTMPSLQKQDLERLEIPTPRLDEQRGIARILSTVQLAIEASARHLTAADRLHDALREGTFISEASSAELRDLVDPTRPICYGIVQPGPPIPTGIPYINVVDITERGSLLLEQIKRTSPDIDRAHKRSRVQIGDIVLAIRGAHDRVAQVPSELDGANLSRGCARIASNGRVSNRFLYHWLHTRAAQDFLAQNFRGVALRQVNIGDLNRLPVPVPSATRMEWIVRALDTSEKALIAATAAIASLQRTFDSAIAHLMTGAA